MNDNLLAGELAALAATERPFQPGECAERARRAAELIGLTGLPPEGTGASFVLWRDEHSVAWLNVMPDPRDTGYHDHDGSAVGVYVLRGSVTNEGLPVGGPRRVHRYGPGDSFSFPGSGIHRMDHDAGAITVHVYSPPLRAIGYYEVIDGLLQRTPGSPDEASPESPELLAVLNRSAVATAGSRSA
ncbi:MAG: hypothetical protein ABSB59_38880 [Streptosporangiaceae bacterium]